MMQKIRNALAQHVLRFSPHARRWMGHLGRYLPVMKDAFPGDFSARLTVFRTLDDIEEGRLNAAKNHLVQLSRTVRDHGGDPERALLCVLKGLYHIQRKDAEQMAHCMREAGKYGHRFHYPHVVLAIHDIYDRAHYERGCRELDAAIDCLYSFPPLDEGKQHGIALMQSLKAYAKTMMHCPADAERLLAQSALAEGEAEHLQALAILRAVQGRREEAEKALSALEKVRPAIHQEEAKAVARVLDGAHPHFTALTPDREAISAYWAWFLQEEKTMRRILTHQGSNACFQHQADAFRKILPDTGVKDTMIQGFRIIDGQPEMHLCACHSRTWMALADAMLEACPGELRATWLVRLTEGAPDDGEAENVVRQEQRTGKTTPTWEE